MTEQTVIFLGPQGSGKGTQVKLLKEFLQKNDPNRQVVHFEAGNALRSFGEEGGYTQEMIHQSLLRGELQPLFVTGFTVARFFINSMKGDEHVVVDGFPRTFEQLEVFDSVVSFYKREGATVLWIDVSDEEAVKRLLARGRNDDTESSIRQRLSWSRGQVRPTLERFKENPKYRVFEIDGARSVEDVHQEILQKLQLS